MKRISLYLLILGLGAACTKTTHKRNSSPEEVTLGAIEAPNSGTAAIRDREGMLLALESATGLSSRTDSNLRGIYNTLFSSLPESPQVSGVNGAVLVAFETLAGEFCVSLMERERNLPNAQRKFFKDVNFNRGLAAFTETHFRQIVEASTRAFWQRSAHPSEFDAIRVTYEGVRSDLDPSSSNSSRALAIGICMTIAGAMQTIVI